MFIKQLQLENFQSHKNTVLNFHPFFNCLIGNGNSGKSSIVRALSFILSGTWDKSWVRHQQDYCRIVLTTDTNIKIIREKGEKVNKYILQVPNQKDQIYENFGKAIPEPIVKILQIFSVQLDKDEELNLNLSNQMDSLFLLSKPGSFKAKLLGKLSGAHFLDHALRELNKDKKNLTLEKRTKEIEVLDLQKKLIEYSDLDERKKRLDVVGIKIEETIRKLEYLDKLKRLFFNTSIWKQQYQDILTQEEKIEKVNTNFGVELDSLVDRFNKLKKIAQKYTDLNQSITQFEEKEVEIESKKQQLVNQYVELLKKHKTCPTCFNSIDAAKVEQVKNSL
jgi:chromosome segregation ATPase